MPTSQTAGFKKAVEDSRKLKAKPNQAELLEMYALFKEGTQDPPIKDAPALGMFDLKEKTKRNKWQELHDTGIKPEDAQKRYVELVGKLKDQYGFDG